MDLRAGDVAVVTGAASGIGLALCERFASEGMRVVMADLEGGPLTAAAANLTASGHEVVVMPTDVSDSEQVSQLALRTFDEFGEVAIVCNNAGVQAPGVSWEMPLEEWRWVLGVNLFGVVQCAHAFVPRMIDSGRPGHIVNTASVAGLLAFGASPYTVSKFGIVGFSEGLGQELRARDAPIGVSVLCPGAVPTGLHRNSERLNPVNRHKDFAHDPGAAPGKRSPAEVADLVVEAVRRDQFWILTHPAYADLIERRTRGILTTGELISGVVL